MTKISSLIITAFLMIVLLSGCSAATVTVTPDKVTVTSTTQAPPVTITATTTKTATTTATTTVISTTTKTAITTVQLTSTSTTPASVFQGTLSGTFSGTKITGDLATGTFSITIDSMGGVQGTISYYDNSYSGLVVGHVDLDGNLNATGTASVGGIQLDIDWQGKLIITGDTLSCQGTFTSQYMTGSFSGSGELIK